MSVNTNYGVILGINGRDVPLAPKDIKNGGTNGYSYELAEPIRVGSIQSLSGFLTTQFDGAVTLPSTDLLPDKLKNAFDKVFNKFLALEMTVNRFKLTVPPKQPDGTAAKDLKTASLSAGISATWPAGQDVELIPGKLGIRGLFLQVDKDDAPLPPPAPSGGNRP